MSDGECFFDTSVLLYLLSEDPARADRVEKLLQTPGVISVQVLNEFTAVATRKLALSLAEAQEILATIRHLCVVHPLSIEAHDRGMLIVQQYRFSVYDSVIVASALLAGCRTLYSEDLQHGQVIDGQVTVINPFIARG